MMPEIKKAPIIYPYIMMLTAFFLMGFVFIVINGPLLLLVTTGKIENNIQDIIKSIGNLWFEICRINTSINFLAFFFISALAIGFLLQAFSQFIAFLFGHFTGLVFKRFGKAFTVMSFTSPEYAKFTDWLLTHKAEKIQWEWEIFNYYFYWGLATNILLFQIFLWTITRSLNIWIFLFWVIIIVYSLGRSFILSNFHNHMLSKMG